MTDGTPQDFGLAVVSGARLLPATVRLDGRGLEWRDPAGHDRWMPYACMRRITVGRLPGTGARLHISGPPGSVLLGGGAPGELDRLLRAIVRQGLAGRVRARLAVNPARCRFPWLWARTGRRATFAELPAEEFSTG